MLDSCVTCELAADCVLLVIFLNFFYKLTLLHRHYHYETLNQSSHKRRRESLRLIRVLAAETADLLQVGTCSRLGIPLSTFAFWALVKRSVHRFVFCSMNIRLDNLKLADIFLDVQPTHLH